MILNDDKSIMMLMMMMIQRQKDVQLAWMSIPWPRPESYGDVGWPVIEGWAIIIAAAAWEGCPGNNIAFEWWWGDRRDDAGFIGLYPAIEPIPASIGLCMPFVFCCVISVSVHLSTKEYCAGQISFQPKRRFKWMKKKLVSGNKSKRRMQEENKKKKKEENYKTGTHKLSSL